MQPQVNEGQDVRGFTEDRPSLSSKIGDIVLVVWPLENQIFGFEVKTVNQDGKS